ncbi:hypothetical protein P3S67_015913 [Capsicum chacoense]
MEKVSLNSQFYFLKKAMKILLPVSLFSLVFSQSYSLLPSLFYSFQEFASYFSVQLFTYSSERNYIFLLCNGILVFIIKNSGLISTNISHHHQHSPKESHKEFKSSEYKNQETKKVFLEKVVEIENKEEQIETMSEVDYQEEKKGQLDALKFPLCMDSKEELDQKGLLYEDYQENDIEIVEELEEDEEELEETLEELHKKCDDFIKKIKKEINGKN